MKLIDRVGSFLTVIGAIIIALGIATLSTTTDGLALLAGIPIVLLGVIIKLGVFAYGTFSHHQG